MISTYSLFARILLLVSTIKELLYGLPLPLPLDLTVMTPHEEAFYGFASSVGAVQLYP